jgi:multiple antibiotic resistance protein
MGGKRVIVLMERFDEGPRAPSSDSAQDVALSEAVFYNFITLLAIVNPIEAGAAFATLTAGATAAQQSAIAARASIVATVILIGFGFAGDILLRALGIGFPAFRIAGGLLLLQVGFNMVFAKDAGTEKLAPDERSAATLADDPSVFPLAIPIITGPGALTTVVAILSKRHETVLESSLVVVTVIVVMGITFLTMSASRRLKTFLGPTGVNAVGRVMGIIVAAIAVQLIVDGIEELLPTLQHAAR